MRHLTVKRMAWAMWVFATILALAWWVVGGPGFFYGLFIGVALGASAVWSGQKAAEHRARKLGWIE